MKLHFVFNDLETDVVGASAVVRLSDDRECDAPAKLISVGKTDTFQISVAEPSIRINAAIDMPVVTDEVSVSISVEGVTAAGDPVKFINTCSTSLTDSEDGILLIVLERI